MKQLEINYIDFIKSFGETFPIKYFREDNIVLRHDVDFSIDHALKMAELENKNNIKSTYYFLPPEYNKANYYGFWKDGKIKMNEEFKDKLNEINKLGHEIGLHTNFLTTHYQSGIHPKILLENEINNLNSLGSFQIISCSSHGDSGARKGNYINYQIFDEFGGKFGLNLKEYDLIEAYLLPYKTYISDSGGRFRISTPKINEKNIINKEKIVNFNNLIVKPCQILLHPIWWK